MTLDSRQQLQRLIGEHAEYLVFVFGMSDRKHLLLSNQSAPYYWVDHRDKKQTRLSGNSLNHLVEIEVANFIEQIPSLAKSDSDVQAAIREMRDRFSLAVPRMSIGAREAFISELCVGQIDSDCSQLTDKDLNK